MSNVNEQQVGPEEIEEEEGPESEEPEQEWEEYESYASSVGWCNPSLGVAR